LSQENNLVSKSTGISSQSSAGRSSSIESVGKFSKWLRSSGLKVVLASLLALIPCFWHPRIEAGDLASHTYNAWLTNLVVHKQAPGLSIAPQKNNILFDVLLLRLSSVFGFAAGERIAVCIAVLFFLWSAFFFCSSFVMQVPWFLLPILISLSYGWTMQMGFFNFYFSLALSFLALAIVMRTRGTKAAYAVVFVPLIWLAHPLGFAWFVAVAFYLIAARTLRGIARWILPVASLALIFLFRLYLAQHYQVSWWRGSFYDLNGTNQLLLGGRYHFLSVCLLLAIFGCVLVHLVGSNRAKAGSSISFPLAAELFILCFLAVSILPDAIWLSRYSEPVSEISLRFTLVLAITGCAALAGLHSRSLFFGLTAVIAVCYCVLVYGDTGKAWAMEQQAEKLVALVPNQSRVISTIFPFRGSSVFVHHVVDRACIGRCFVIDNYEPASGQFRLRANSESTMAAASSEDTNRMMLGIYVVKPSDLPVWQILQCGLREIDLCLRPLQAGPLTGQPSGQLIRARDLN
jgi:hypothetical protein